MLALSFMKGAIHFPYIYGVRNWYAVLTLSHIFGVICLPVFPPDNSKQSITKLKILSSIEVILTAKLSYFVNCKCK